MLSQFIDAGTLDRAGESTAALLKAYRVLEASIPAPVYTPAAVDGSGVDECIFIRGGPKKRRPGRSAAIHAGHRWR